MKKFLEIGGIVAGSSMYVVQGSSKVTKYWSSGHIRVMLKVKNGGSLISGGQVTVFSRQYGQKYSHFDVDMSAGGENPAAMSTEVDSNISLTLSAALALASKVTITVGATTLDLNNGNGSRNYSGTIALDGTISLAQLYQYLQAICSEDPSGSIGVSIGGVPGWRFRALGAFSENIAAPFGTFAGGKFFFAQGWAVTGVQVADATNYQLIDNTGATQSPPVNASIVVSNLADNDYVLVGRDTGSDIDQAEYTVNGAIVGSTSLVVTPSIKTDTPSSGVVRVNGVRYTYTSWSGSTFTLSAPATISNGLPVFVPFIDQAVSGVTSLTASFKYNANFTYRVKVRSGSGSSPIIPFETTGTSTSGAASVAAVRTLDV